MKVSLSLGALLSLDRKMLSNMNVNPRFVLLCSAFETVSLISEDVTVLATHSGVKC